MESAGEPVLVCPYDKSHAILKSRMQFHLVKCRAQHQSTDTVICGNNRTHIIPRRELELHSEICESRIVSAKYLYDVGNSDEDKALEKYPIPKIEVSKPGVYWDEADPQGSVVEGIKEKAVKKFVILKKIGGSKSEKKYHRECERLRMARLARQDDKQQI